MEGLSGVRSRQYVSIPVRVHAASHVSSISIFKVKVNQRLVILHIDARGWGVLLKSEVSRTTTDGFTAFAVIVNELPTQVIWYPYTT